MPVPSIGGSEYFITFIDDYSRRIHLVRIKSKDEAKRCVQEYIARLEGKLVKRYEDSELTMALNIITEK